MKFEKIYIELSDICGLNCGFCPSVKGVRGAMSVEKFGIIAKKVAGVGRIYTFHLLGDPLVLPNLKDFVKIANAHKMTLELTTSGFYMSEKNAQLLLESENIRQINLSLMAFLAQKKLNLNEYFTPILRFLRLHLAQNSQSFVNLRLWNLGANFTPPPENNAIYSLLEREFNTKIQKNAPKNRLENRIILHQSELFCWAGAKAFSKADDLKAQKEFANLQDKANLKSTQKSIANAYTMGKTSFEKTFMKENSKIKDEENLKSANFANSQNEKNAPEVPCVKGSCHALRKQIGILSDGTVVPCCMDTSGVMGLGNLFTQELSEILASKRAVAMKKGFERGEFTEKLCQQCEFGRQKTRH